MKRAELELTIKLDKLYHLDLDTDLDIKKTEINDEMIKQPGQFAWYATLNELAKNKVQTLKSELELLEATLDQKTRRDWDDSQGKMTETSVSAKIKMSPEYKELISRYLEAQKSQGILSVARSAFEQRKDMLISLASNLRSELDSDLKINKEKVANTIRKMRNN